MGGVARLGRWWTVMVGLAMAVGCASGGGPGAVHEALAETGLTDLCPGAREMPAPAEAALAYGSDVQVVSRGGMSPFASIERSLRLVQGRALLSLAWTYHGGWARGERTTLVAEDPYRALLQRLQGCGEAWPAADGDVAEASRRVVWDVRWQHEVRVLDEGGAREWRGFEPLEGAAGRCLSAFFAEVDAALGGPEFVPSFVAEEERGWLDVMCHPPARISVSGMDWGAETPLYDLYLPAGVHTVRVWSAELGVQREVDVVLEAGVKTMLDLELLP